MIRQLIALCMGRSWRWPAVRDEHLRRHPECAACGRAVDLEVHHITPVGGANGDPSLELDPTNLMTLCRRDHFLIGHLDSWRSINRNAVEDAAIWLRKIRGRP